MVDVYEYYSRRYVMEEIGGFLIGRWVGIEGFDRKWVRWVDDKPLVVKSFLDIPVLIRKYSFIKPRSFYGSIEVFHRLVNREDVMDRYRFNVAYVTPFIDIDIVDDQFIEDVWRSVVEIGVLIRDWLRDNGVVDSVYFLWSGAGMHVRINEYCFEESIKEYHPLDVAYVFTEYILRSTRNEILELINRSGGKIKVENLVSMKRVFTAPLSLHRRLDRVAVAFSPSKLEEFDLSWTLPEKTVYEEKIWNIYVRGECDDLAFKAIRSIEGISRRTVIGEVKEEEKREEPVIVRSIAVREPGRFPVMALLQAARYYLFNRDLDKAKSFGLNRAIFYAWAKYYGPGKQVVFKQRPKKIYGSRVEGSIEWVEECGERVQRSSSGYYVMGGVEQRPEDFDRYVKRRFEENGLDFNEVWEKTLEYLKKFPKTVLRDPQLFYKEVYEPVRDKFIERVVRKKKSSDKSLEKWFRSGK